MNQRYEEWLRSAEWQALRERVLKRSPWCEACLVRRSEEVHHESYAFGWAPPLWLLRGVCRQCHRALHDGDHDWCDVDGGMARA